MSTVVTLHDVAASDVVSIRAAVPERDLPAFIGRAFGDLRERLNLLGIAPDAEPFVVLHGAVPGAVDVEACLPVHPEIAASGGMETQHLDATRVARIIHHGPAVGLPATCAFLMAWLEAHHLEPAGLLRERCLAGPADVASPEDWTTDLQLPVRESGDVAGDPALPIG